MISHSSQYLNILIILSCNISAICWMISFSASFSFSDCRLFALEINHRQVALNVNLKMESNDSMLQNSYHPRSRLFDNSLASKVSLHTYKINIYIYYINFKFLCLQQAQSTYIPTCEQFTQKSTGLWASKHDWISEFWASSTALRLVVPVCPCKFSPGLGPTLHSCSYTFPCLAIWKAKKEAGKGARSFLTGCQLITCCHHSQTHTHKITTLLLLLSPVGDVPQYRNVLLLYSMMYVYIHCTIYQYYQKIVVISL